MKITVLGTGGWGMALSMVLCRNGHEVTAWTFFEEECRNLRATRSNEKLLPGVRLPDEIALTTDMSCVKDAELVVMAVPSFVVASTAASMAEFLPEGIPVVNVGKGLDAKHGFCRFSETIEHAIGGKNPVVALTGPTHAEEVAREIPTTIVAASINKYAAELVQDVFMNEYFRVYTSSDIIGCELGGAFKNIIALGAGIIDGIGLGDNSKAAFMTRGLTEIARLGMALGARQDTFAGLSGVGDLIVTCTSMHSRNRRAGILIGQGKDAQTAMKEVGAVVEGYYATEAGYHLAKKMRVPMPICESMYHVLYEGGDVKEAVSALMTRDKKDEHESESIWVTHKS
ncbi:MAG: NAD(P)-dependent glycerol-3-phosphate dehydrogenase [Butyricicoccus sp.]|nr:NAD(P)-dependent glycerol-3-phosphate dehydrogenase [Butyricicoccus sp.]